MKKSLFVLFISMITCMPLSAEILQGRIMQNDSTPCAFATVYIPSLNRGTSANQNGDYYLDELPAGKLKVEYSCIGQQSVHRELDIVAGQPLTNNEKLEEAVVMLPPSIITPNGESPSHYVLRHVWEQAEKNRKRIQSWDADLKYELGLNDIEMFLNIIPKKYITAFKVAAAMFGMRKFVNLIFDHPDLKIKVALNRSYLNGKVTDSNQQILYCNHNLTKDEQKTLFKDNKMLIDENIYDDVYSAHCPWGKKGSLRDSLRLTGSYEMDGKVIDVLEHKATRIIKDEEADTVKVRTYITRIHVVEDAWGILKVERKSHVMNSLRECRDLGGGIYMPISASTKTELRTIKAEEIPDIIKKAEEQDTSKFSKSEMRIYKALLEEMRKHQGRDIEININLSYSIRYNRFEYK